MTEAQFADWSLRLLLPALIGWMAFIVWGLARESRAGKFGTFVMFGVLGLGVLGFVAKNVITYVMAL